MGSTDILHLEMTVSESSFRDDAKTILARIRPNWDLEQVKYKHFNNGITNKLLGCYQAQDPDNIVLVRVNGAGSEILIDRNEEQETFRVLSAKRCAPPVYCVFNNGMAYGFFPGQPLDEKSVRDPLIQRLIAEEMVRMHEVRGNHADQCPGEPQSQYRERAQSYLDSSPVHFDCPLKQEVFERTIPNKARLQAELNEIVEHLDGLHLKAVFSHNDLLLQNIVFDQKTNTLHFIDYEYAFYNYEPYDIANHFAEYAGLDEVNYDLYPLKDEQVRWLRHYLQVKARAEGRCPEDVTENDVERLYIQTNKCTCASHFFWGIWALIQAEHSTIDFDYLEYANIRLTEYFRRKKEFFPLQVPPL